jgi:hypothetical protein
VGTHTMQVGGIYLLRSLAINDVGSSDPSEELAVALARLPNKPLAPTFSSQSTRNSHIIEWVDAESLDTPILGYKLYSDNGQSGNQYLIWNGAHDTQTISFTHSVEVGVQYSYWIEAYNFNGATQSDVSTKFGCVSPTNF